GLKLGYDPFPIHFDIVPASIMYEVGAYLLPGRFSHWTHGKAFHQMKTMYDYGLSKIYELIINSNPAQALLMEGNSLIHNKFVVAHVIGHSDFFKHNAHFQGTSRQMVETVNVHAERIRRSANGRADLRHRSDGDRGHERREDVLAEEPPVVGQGDPLRIRPQRLVREVLQLRPRRP
ncbi:MAG: hypothetical protein C4321_08285, partial [Chloroflexota bacterium]